MKPNKPLGNVKPPKINFFLNKVVVITGASSGIGRTLSFWYLNNGAKVVLVARDI
jgi:NADP-dependent 3-hydroxy acid dehydrogenase YdfG